MKLIFVRHGDTNVKTGKLTMRGRRQVKDTSKYLQNEKVSAIFCSPRTRTLQSANILNAKRNVPLYIIKEINERPMLSTAESLMFGDEFEKNYLNYDYTSDRFETCKMFIDRCFEGIRKIIRKSKSNATVLVVAHSSTLYAINAFITGIPKDKKIKWLQCSNGAAVKFFI